MEAAKVAYLEASSAGDASDNFGEVLRAAHEGRVSALLAQDGAEIWGSYDAGAGRVAIHAERKPLDSDLLDLAVRQTILHGGDGYLVAAEEMPCPGALGAVYRF